MSPSERGAEQMIEPNTDSLAIDRTRPMGAWRFDEGVAEVFDNMLERSIPQYEVMRQVVFEAGRRFLTPGGTIVDCGASRGGAIAPFVDEYGDEMRYVCLETAAPMADVLRNRFSDEMARGVVDVHEEDLRSFYPEVTASLTLLVLTLQFVPLEHRQAVLRRVGSQTAPGGAVVLVEKVLGATADLSEMMVDIYHQYKRDHGYSNEDVVRKALALEGVLVPVQARWNEELLEHAGFTHVECVWRWMNFAAWVGVKPSALT